MLETTLDEVKAWITIGTAWRKLFRYRRAHLLVPRLEVLPRPFLLTLLLRLLSRGPAIIEDAEGRRQRIGPGVIGRRLLRLVRDGTTRARVFADVRREIRQLAGPAPGDDRRPRSRVRPGRPIYLRTDLWFGIRSGGSVGHIAGVLNNLDGFGRPPLLVTTDTIPTVRADIETKVVTPESRYWDFAEVPSLYLNQTLYPVLEESNPQEGLAFVYQRYSRNNYCGLKLARSHGVPLVLEYNGSEVWMARHWNRPLKHAKLTEEIELLNLLGADIVVVVSQPMHDELVERGIEKNKILVNPNGVDPDRYSPAVDGSAVRESHHLEGKVVVGFIGTFGRWHGAEVLAEAFGRLLDRSPEYRDRLRLMMIGDGLTMPEVRATLDRHGASSLAVLTGLVPQEDGPRHMAACDLLVAPHVPNADGTPFFGSPTKLFEYMAMGKGIVASDLDQIGEVLEHDRTAWLVGPGDPEALMHGLEVLIEDLPRRNRLGKAARAEIVDRYSWKEHTRRIMEKLEARCR